uniref:Sushi domain-containing protein n=1 Tax=Scleropages formosus TaxID=113540 RepID=A0A8C9SJY5_SCLFO
MSCFLHSCASDTCSVPPHKNHTVPFNQMEQYPEKTRLRYTCKDGYLRKAGTSSLIQCKRNGTSLWWDNVSGSVSLVCIRKGLEANPKRTESPSTAYPSQQVETTSPGLWEALFWSTDSARLPGSAAKES